MCQELTLCLYLHVVPMSLSQITTMRHATSRPLPLPFLLPPPPKATSNYHHYHTPPNWIQVTLDFQTTTIDSHIYPNKVYQQFQQRLKLKCTASICQKLQPSFGQNCTNNHSLLHYQLHYSHLIPFPTILDFEELDRFFSFSQHLDMEVSSFLLLILDKVTINL